MVSIINIHKAAFASIVLLVIAGCSSRIVDIRPYGPISEEIRQNCFYNCPQTAYVVNVFVNKQDYERSLIRRSLALYVSDCSSHEPWIVIGYGGQFSRVNHDGNEGYVLRFPLMATARNQSYSHNWRDRLRCVFVGTAGGYTPSRHISNIIHLTQ